MRNEFFYGLGHIQSDKSQNKRGFKKKRFRPFEKNDVITQNGRHFEKKFFFQNDPR